MRGISGLFYDFILSTGFRSGVGRVLLAARDIRPGEVSTFLLQILLVFLNMFQLVVVDTALVVAPIFRR